MITGGGYMEAKQLIENGKAVLGIEFGSTRIKAVLMDAKGSVLASGGHGWENRYEEGVWTYSLDDIWTGLQDCYRDLCADVEKKYQTPIRSLAAIGFSAMMHGYLAFDKNGELLVPFRTWRNTITEEAAGKLTEEFSYNIPQRWSISHLYQAILNQEAHVRDISYLTTLAGYVHWKLTGKKVLGIGDASGMFPIDTSCGAYDAGMMAKFDALVAGENLGWTLSQILPEVLMAGEDAGTLTPEGAALLDTSGALQAGIPCCPPEGDAGTGMVATNSVGVRTGNISAGTSVFAMVVLEKELSKVYPQIDLVTTPDGKLVGMVHCNNCTSEINAWVNLFAGFMQLMGQKPDMNELFTKLYGAAMDGAADCGGLLSYNYFSGEPVTGFDKGAIVFARNATAQFTVENVMRMHLYSALAALKVGMDLMIREEGVKVDEMFGHGGYFKTKGVGQQIAADAIGAPVSVMETASEGGAWGAGLLAAYMVSKEEQESLAQYLQNKIFAGQTGSRLAPVAEQAAGFDAFMQRYEKGLAMEREAVKAFGE